MIASCRSNCSCNVRVFKVNQFIAQIEENRLCRPNNQSGIEQPAPSRKVPIVFPHPPGLTASPGFSRGCRRGVQRNPWGAAPRAMSPGPKPRWKKDLRLARPRQCW